MCQMAASARGIWALLCVDDVSRGVDMQSGLIETPFQIASVPASAILQAVTAMMLQAPLFKSNNAGLATDFPVNPVPLTWHAHAPQTMLP